jgi:Ner family transcriptional regulator
VPLNGNTEELEIGWNRFDIVAAVRKRGSTLAGVARGVGLSRKSMSWALIRPHEKANRAIAKFLEVSPHELWPAWFDTDGRRIPARSPSPRSPSPTTRVSESSPTASPLSNRAA